MEHQLLEDIIEWDIVNWSKALNYWNDEIDISSTSLTALELGGRRGGLSLWLATENNIVICSDLTSPAKSASLLHSNYDVKGSIRYEAIDAINIPYEDHFDIVAFKSILGGISRSGKDELKKRIILEIYKSLKPGGKLCSQKILNRLYSISF